MNIIEIRTYKLKPDSGARFYACFYTHVLPLLTKWGIDVVACGLSQHDPDAAYLIRNYDTLAEREGSQDAFYSSSEWREGPRRTVLGFITHYTDVVLEVDDPTLAGLRGLL